MQQVRLESVPEATVTLLKSCTPPALDRLGDYVSDLCAVQERTMRNYFRLARAHEELKRRRPKSQPVAEWVSQQLEMERARLARELHASSAQALAGIKIHLEVIRAVMPDPPAAVNASLECIDLLAQEAMQQLRTISHRLQPPDWQRLGLEAAIRHLWNLSGIPQRFKTDLVLGPLEEEPPYAIQTAVYRSVQEALANTIRHSGATRIDLRLTGRDGQVLLTVEDNGEGFDAERLLNGPEGPAGIGLRSMRSQIENLRGEFKVRSGPDGTRLSIRLPLGGRL